MSLGTSGITGFHSRTQKALDIREMEITHKSARFVLRRIRHGMGVPDEPKLTGTIEVDEVYVGGRPRYLGQSKAGRGTSKTPLSGWSSATVMCGAARISEVGGQSAV